MSSIATTTRRQRPDYLDDAVDETEKADLPFTPREGWLSVIALMVMLLVVAVAIDDSKWAGWTPGTSTSQTGFLFLAALISVGLGTVLSKTALSILRINLFGILVGAAVLLFFVSAAVSPAHDLFARLHDLNKAVGHFADDVFVRGVRSTESSIFLLLIGALVWGAGIFCAVCVFRRNKPLPAIVLAGALLLLNVSITIREQYFHILIFTAAALALAVRLNLREQAREWRMRGMRNVADISSSFMHSGAVFIAAAVIGSSLLAANASSAPLARGFGRLRRCHLDFRR